MQLSISEQELKSYLKNQLSLFFPDRYGMEGKDVDQAFRLSLETTGKLFFLSYVSSIL